MGHSHEITAIANPNDRTILSIPDGLFEQPFHSKIHHKEQKPIATPISCQL